MLQYLLCVFWFFVIDRYHYSSLIRCGWLRNGRVYMRRLLIYTTHGSKCNLSPTRLRAVWNIWNIFYVSRFGQNTDRELRHDYYKSIPGQQCYMRQTTTIIILYSGRKINFQKTTIIWYTYIRNTYVIDASLCYKTQSFW